MSYMIGLPISLVIFLCRLHRLLDGKVLRYSKAKTRPYRITLSGSMDNKREIVSTVGKTKKRKALQSIIIVRTRNKRHSDILSTVESYIIYLGSLYQIADTKAEHSSHFTSRSLPCVL